MIYAASGFIGNFSSTSVLIARYPPLQYAGRMAAVSTEDSTQLYYSDGFAWSLIPESLQATAIAAIVGGNERLTTFTSPTYGYAEAVALFEQYVRDWDVVEWEASEVVALGAVRAPTVFSDGTNLIAMKVHRCTTAGTTGTSEPTWATTAGNTTNDGTAVWTAYPAYFFDADNGNDTTGNGSQATPWKTFDKLTVFGGGAILRTGNAIFLKRGCTLPYSGTQPSVTRNAVISVQKDGGDTADTRRNIGAYGTGSRPVLDATGVQYGVIFSTTSGTGANNNCNTTLSNLDIYNVTADGTPGNAIGGIGIRAPASASSVGTNLKIISCRVRNVINASASSSASTDDFNGIQISGTGTLIGDTDVQDIDDDGIWLDGTDSTTLILNRVVRCAQAFTRVGRVAGDCLQISSSAAQNNVTLLWNVFDHRDAGCKHALIANPTSASTGWVIDGNTFIGAVQTTATATAHYPIYIARVTGTFTNNFVHSNRVSDNVSGYALIAATLTMKNNVFFCRNGSGGMSLTVSGDAGSPSANNAVVDFNTFISIGTPGAFGLAKASAVTGTSAYNNAFILFDLAINYAGTGTLGPQAFQRCTVGLGGSGSPTRVGTDVTGTLLYDGYGLPITGSEAVGAGEHQSYSTDALGTQRRNPPTIGAYESKNPVV